MSHLRRNVQEDESVLKFSLKACTTVYDCGFHGITRTHLVGDLCKTFLGNDLVSLGLAQFEVFTALQIGIVAGGVEEVAHVLNNGACLAELLQRASALAAEGGGESAGLNRLSGY
jgi:hypothetical protein